MPGVQINLSGDAAFMKKLEGLGTTLTDFREGLEEAGKDMQAYFSGQVFASQGGVLGTPWEQLSPSTQIQKAKHFRQYTNAPLIATGTMQHSFAHKAGPMHLEVTNSAPYFVYHQSTAERSKLPRRPMMGINADIKSIIKNALHKAMVAKIAGL